MGSEKLNVNIINQIRKAFENQCIYLLIDSYKKLKTSNSYDVSWEEEKISMELARLMENCDEADNWRIHIISEPRLYTEEMHLNNTSPKEAPRIDFRLLNWSTPNKFSYNIEAKNLAENDWTKRGGALVSSSFLTGRFIDTGIENFINGRYQNGCLVGYVLNGKIGGVVDRINALLTKRNRSFETLSIASPVNNYNFCYQSLHQKETTGENFILPHVFVEF